MKIDLYPCFEHLKQYNAIWLYSDPHFGDEEMQFIRKDYIGDDEQVRRINSKVGKKDVIIILGDIGDISYIEKIRGYKILVLGNHDKGKSYYQKDNDKNRLLFDEVYNGIVTLNDKIVLSHEPIDMPFMFNIHGHDHSNTEGHLDDIHLNVCAEYINYTPVNLGELVKQGVFKNVPNIHRTIIEIAKERKIREQLEKWDSDRPVWDEVFVSRDDLPPRIEDSGYVCDCFGYIEYKGNIYPLYTDDYGCQDFIIYRYRNNGAEIVEYVISVQNMGGMLDWWFELNRMKDEHPDEVILHLDDIGAR